MPLDPNDHDAKLNYGEDGWWGVAIQETDLSFSVIRLGTEDQYRQRADEAARLRVWIGGSNLDPDEERPHIVAERTPGARYYTDVWPGLSSGDMGRTWVLSAYGWTLPEVVHRG